MPAHSGPILAISGSLRRSSINSAVLRAAADAAARDGVSVVVSDAVRTLPQFDPDLEPAPPASVVEVRAACDGALAALLAVPEYAFGIPGAFKNALDWTNVMRVAAGWRSKGEHPGGRCAVAAARIGVWQVPEGRECVDAGEPCSAAVAV
jgi:NAD(P)H-dependent FMN reductase